jgi:hypothetical protein
MNRKLTFPVYLGLIAAALLVIGTAVPQSQAQDNSKARAIEGTWDIVIVGSPFRILRTYGREGGIVDAYAFPPFTATPGPLINSPGHGAWVKHKGGREFGALVKYFQINPAAGFGLLDSFGIVKETITLSADGDSYTSDFSTDIFLPNGLVPIIHNAGKTQAVRIVAQ